MTKMSIIDLFWIDSHSFICTVEIANGLYADVKTVFDGNDTAPLIYVMDNGDGTQLYDENDVTYNMSESNQALVCRFVEGKVMNDEIMG